jgi:hypothetical protein
MHNSNHAKHYTKQLLSHTQKNTTAVQLTVLFNWNTSLFGYKEGTVAFPLRKPWSRSTVNFTVSICTQPTTYYGRFEHKFTQTQRAAHSLKWGVYGRVLLVLIGS